MASATHSASDSSSRHLLELSHDELGVIVDGLADPLQPVVAVHTHTDTLVTLVRTQAFTLSQSTHAYTTRGSL